MTLGWISGMTLTCAAGTGLGAVRSAIRERRTGLRPHARPDVSFDTWLGQVDGLDTLDWPESLRTWDSRNNRLAWLGVQQDELKRRLDGATDLWGAARIGLVLGTSTASIERTEAAYAALEPGGGFSERFLQPAVHAPHSTGAFLAQLLGIGGPALTISTACSSSAKVFATAARWLKCGLVDAVLVGGVDSLCRSTIYGFESLQLVARGLCRPFDARRDGLNIGEAAAFALLTREAPADPMARLLGYGESSDAHHMSSPHPEGRGAQTAMQQALMTAGVRAHEIGYLNLHGTGTRANDAVESLAVAAVLPPEVPASSTKGWTGHTLGAGGIVEAVLCMDSFATGLLPGNLNLECAGEDIVFPVLRDNRPATPAFVLSNSFGFGGNNCTLLFGRPG